MRKEVRERAFTPIMLPLTILAGVLLFAFSLSRVLLAVSATTAALVAVLLAGYILALAFLMEARRRISSSSLAIAVGVGLIGVVAAGAAANAAGMRLVGSESEQAAPPEAGAGPAGTEGGAAPEGELFVADDIFYEEAPETVPAGRLTFVLENRGDITHNVTIEETGDQLVVEAEGGETASGEVTLDPGEYTYYCSIPGHREAGMEGTLRVE